MPHEKPYFSSCRVYIECRTLFSGISPSKQNKRVGRLQPPVLSLGLSKDVLSSVLFDVEGMCDEGGVHRGGSCLGFRV